jgi:hypothetical protein
MPSRNALPRRFGIAACSATGGWHVMSCRDRRPSHAPGVLIVSNINTTKQLIAVFKSAEALWFGRTWPPSRLWRRITNNRQEPNTLAPVPCFTSPSDGSRSGRSPSPDGVRLPGHGRHPPCSSATSTTTHCLDDPRLVLQRWDMGAGRIPAASGRSPLARSTALLFGEDVSTGGPRVPPASVHRSTRRARADRARDSSGVHGKGRLGR